MRPARSCCGEQAIFDTMQAFPRGFGKGRIGPDNFTNHLPGGEIERSFRRGTHRQRNGALRTKTDSLRWGFLARPDSGRLREKEYGNRFLAGFELSVAAKTI